MDDWGRGRGRGTVIVLCLSGFFKLLIFEMYFLVEFFLYVSCLKAAVTAR